MLPFNLTKCKLAITCLISRRSSKLYLNLELFQNFILNWFISSPPLSLIAIFLSTIHINQYSREPHGPKHSLLLSSVVVNCSDPGLVENGVRQSGLRYPEVFSYGVTVAIHCKRGFYLLGSALLTCQHDGRWDRPIPHCLGMDWQIYNIVNWMKMSCEKVTIF